MRQSVFSLLLFRSETQVSFICWTKFILLECYLGEQLIEMLATTASFRKPQTQKDPAFHAPANGWNVNLPEYIPSTFINKCLQKQIIQLLEIKFTSHYKILLKKEGKIYTHNPNNLFLLTELKLAYNTIWITINITIDILVYILTKDLTLTILTGGIIEFLRRFKW